MKIIFLGSSDYSFNSLNAIIKQNKHEIIAIFTQPNKINRRKQLQVPYLKTEIENIYKDKFIFFQPENINNCYELIKSLNPDLILTASYGQILSKKIITIPKYGSINIHASYLPEYRGASPIRQAILDGKNQTGITSIFMEESLDTGDIIEQVHINIQQDENFSSLYNKFLKIIPSFTLQTISIIENKKNYRKKQSIDNISFTKKNITTDSFIDWNNDCLINERIIRAYSKSPGAYCFLYNMRLKIFEARAINIYHEYNPGLIVNYNRESFRVSCKEGYLDIYELQISGKNIVLAKDFINGNKKKLDFLLSQKKF